MCDIMTSSSNCAFPLFVSKSSIGYPVVYLGFDATCYFTNIFKLRIQKAVQSENDFHMHLLQHSLPPGLQVYPKTGTDGGGGKLSSPSITTHTHTHTSEFVRSLKAVDRHNNGTNEEISVTGLRCSYIIIVPV